MKSSTKNEPKSTRDVAYYRQRYQNRVFAKLVAWVAEECQREQITKKDLAERMGKDPAQVSRLLSQPSNLTLDTITDLLLSFDAEGEPPEIVRFADRSAPNYVHPLIARITNTAPSDRLASDKFQLTRRAKDAEISPINRTKGSGSTVFVPLRPAA